MTTDTLREVAWMALAALDKGVAVGPGEKRACINALRAELEKPAPIPPGWAFYSADFSMQAGGHLAYGSAGLVRDIAGKSAWMGLDDATRLGIPLYVWGQGATVADAIADAGLAALEAPTIPTKTEAAQP